MKQVIFFTLFWATSCMSQGALEEKPKQEASAAELATGTLSPHNEQLVREILKKLDFNEQVASIFQPSRYLMDTIPLSKYEAVFEPQHKALSLNEKWFDALSQDEKVFVIGKQVLKVKNEKTRQHNDFKKNVLRGALALFELSIIYLLYVYLRKRERFSYISWWKRLLFAIAVIAIPYELLLEPQIMGKYEDAIMYDNAAQTIKTLGCLEGSLAFLKRMREELAPVAHTEYWKKYCQAVEKLIPYIESLKKR
jgi:hypothetical protein